MSCHVPAAVLINLDGRRLSCLHWTPLDVVSLWSLCGFYMVSQCWSHCCPPFTETAQTTWVHQQWDPLAGACSSDVRCPGTSEHPARHAAAFSRTGCAVISTQTLLTQMTYRGAPKAVHCGVPASRTFSHQAFPSQLLPAILLARPFHASD